MLCAQSLWLLVLDSSAYADTDDKNYSEEASSMMRKLPRNVPLLYRPYTDDNEVDWEDRGSSNSSELLGIDAALGMLCVMLCITRYKESHLIACCHQSMERFQLLSRHPSLSPSFLGYF